MASTRTAAVGLGGDVEGILGDLAGISPALDRVLDGLADLAREATTPVATADALLALAGDGPNVVELIGRIITRLGDPYTNPAMAALPIGPSRTVQRATEQYAVYLTAWAPAHLPTEAAAAIHD
ncbi:MAG: hypothetical protein JWO98_4946 [Frankiales bacterium]|nr:hypothetical protein [Frankiales bacterium]